MPVCAKTSAMPISTNAEPTADCTRYFTPASSDAALLAVERDQQERRDRHRLEPDPQVEQVVRAAEADHRRGHRRPAARSTSLRPPRRACRGSRRATRGTSAPARWPPATQADAVHAQRDGADRQRAPGRRPAPPAPTNQSGTPVAASVSTDEPARRRRRRAQPHADPSRQVDDRRRDEGQQRAARSRPSVGFIGSGSSERQDGQQRRPARRGSPARSSSARRSASTRSDSADALRQRARRRG